MYMTSLYSADDIRNTYEPIQDHRHTKHIIQSYALNPRDIREMALDGLDLASVKNVLDLGCGYGFFTEKLRGRLHEGAYIEGIDVIDRNNREAFEDTVDAIGCQGRFIQGRADLIQKMADSSYDVIIASYSLYFFPHLIPDIARILSPGGIFLAVTHSKYSLQEVTQFIPACMQMIGLAPPDEIMINRLLDSFSLENGFLMLKEYFESVEKIIYKNDLYFPLDQVGDCINYLDKKKHLIFKEVSENHPDKVEDMLSCFNKIIYEHALLHGEVIITKDDAIFRCFKSHSRTS
jgi:SAM-dependent methyltransferase